VERETKNQAAANITLTSANCVSFGFSPCLVWFFFLVLALVVGLGFFFSFFSHDLLLL
jgi:hypothetical protein